MKEATPRTGEDIGPITELLESLRTGGDLDGEGSRRERLVQLAYPDLRRLAERCLVGEAAGNSLTVSDLAHEALLRLAAQRQVDCRDRTHLYSVAARMMRRILIDRARRRRAVRHGAGMRRVPLDRAETMTVPQADRLLAIDEALTGLCALDPLKAAVVELRFFGGLSLDETALALDRSRATVHRHWRVARGWLRRELGPP